MSAITKHAKFRCRCRATGEIVSTRPGMYRY
jgi:hypothetical protein